MLKIKIFPFNPFQVNTYVLYDETGECVIIDASCYEVSEKNQLQAFIDENELKPVFLLNTHCHIDHILGNNFVYRTWGLKPLVHKDSIPFLDNAAEYGQAFGFEVEKQVMPEDFISEGQIIRFGDQQLKVLETPGHAAGSVCFLHEKENFVIAGDVLFHNSIGRTDLPTGDFDMLINSIRSKLMVLPDDTRVYCGHGPATSIGNERKENPFL